MSHQLFFKKENTWMYTLYDVVQYYPWFKFYFPLFWDVVMYNNGLETKENKIKTRDKTESQHKYA